MNIFDSIRVKKPPYSMFDLSHDVKMSGKMGYLIPCLTQEVIPGDRFRMSSEAMCRLMPMVAPIMHKVDITFHCFFVPNRILWPNWEQFITGGQEGSAVPALPTVRLTEVNASSLANYLGCPVKTALSMPAQDISAFPFAAYQMIWHEYYADENLMSPDFVPLVDGDQGVATGTLEVLHKRCWQHDYFTSALPWAQKGASVELPVDFSNTEIVAVGPTQTATGFNPVFRNSVTDAPLPGTASTSYLNTNNFGSTGLTTSGVFEGGYYDPLGTLEVDGTAGTTINDLRAAYALQSWLEKNARAGSRMSETLLSSFNVRSSDARLQKPEYLGGSKASVAISEVLQTSSTDATTPQANMAGHGISVTSGRDYSHFVEEWGWIICLVNIQPITAYYAGLPRYFSKLDRFDYYWPEFAFLGEQAIRNDEVSWVDDPAVNAEPWGYIPRYSEYRYNPSRVVGQMATTLEYWHMGRKFDNTLPAPPPLNGGFVTADPTKRIFAVTDPDEDEIVMHIFHRIMARRPLPKYGTPSTF